MLVRAPGTWSLGAPDRGRGPVTGFVVRRLVSATLVVILTSMFVFVLFFKGMGDAPARQLLRGAQGRSLHHAQARLDQAPDGLRPVGGLQLRPVGQGHLRRPHERLQRRQALRLPGALPRHLDHHQPAGVDRPRAEVPRDARARGRRRHPLPDPGRLPRRPGRALAGHLCRPTPGGRDAGRLVHPLLRHRPAVVDLPLPPAPDLPEHRVLPDHREPRSRPSAT